MKIRAVTVERQENEGEPALVCLITWEDGSQSHCAHPWRNTLGLWASPDEERNPAEIAAAFRGFARAIDEAAKERAAA